MMLRDPLPRGALRPRVLAPLIAGWLTVVAAGLGTLTYHSFVAGEQAVVPALWPRDSALGLAAQGPTLVVVAHPQCGCTRASIAELDRLMTRIGGQLTAYVLFSVPAGMDDEGRETELFRQASAIDGVTVIADRDGVEAARFGAATSGQVYLFDAAGELRFEGGITPSRAHEGDSVGRQQIIALVEGDTTQRKASAVYGCGLWDAAAQQFWLRQWRPAALALGHDDERRSDDGRDEL
jgi:hypothetical protein